MRQEILLAAATIRRAFSTKEMKMTDKLGRTLEHRIIILEKRLDNIEDAKSSLLLSLIKWLDDPTADRKFLRVIVEEKLNALKAKNTQG